MKRNEKAITNLQRENNRLKKNIAEKELELQMKTELFKKNATIREMKEIVSKYKSKGLPISKAVTLANMSRSSYYYKSS